MPAIVVSFLVVIGALTGLLLTRWRARRFAGWCLLAGVVIAVGVHPIDDPSLLMTPVANHATSTLALAFRSSTRAVPVVLLVIALGLGALASWIGARLPSARRLAEIGLAALVIVNLPALWRGELVNPAQSRDQDVPAPWLEAAADLDAGVSGGGRVLQIPGSEFGVHRWGYLVDPLLPGITDRPVVTRDFAPVGSPAAIDLLYALDDRLQDGTLEPSAIAPIARLLGVDQVLLTGDLAYERFRTRHPALVEALLAGAPDVGPLRPYGPAAVDAAPGVVALSDLASRPTDQPIAAVSLGAVESPVPIVRTKVNEVVVVGSGMGLVDAAAAGLIDGTELVRYSGSFDEAPADPAGSVIITDTNRKQAHQWRGSRDVLGMTEDRNAAVLDEDIADQRLPVFPERLAERYTTAEQRGPLAATASSYGDPISYRPEDRAVMAIDGDLSTAWLVADRAEPVGERIRVSSDDGSRVSEVRLLQDQTPDPSRWITEVIIRSGNDPGNRSTVHQQRVTLDETSRTGQGQLVPVESVAGDYWAEIEIAATTTGRRDAYPFFGPVGFAEISVDGLGPTTEVVVLPSDATTLSATDDVSIVLTRWRAESTDPVRRDPEPAISREWSMATAREFELTGTARLASRVTDRQLADLFGFTAVPSSSGSLVGEPGSAAWAAFDGDSDTSWVSTAGELMPTLGVTFAEARTVAAFDLTFDVAADRSLPAAVSVLANGAVDGVDVPLTITGDGTAHVEFPPITTDGITIRFPVEQPTMSIDLRTSEPIALPVAVREVSVPGLESLVPGDVDAGCRDDLLRLDGQPVSVRLETTTDSLLGRSPIALTTCDGKPLVLSAGTHHVVTATGAATALEIDQLVLRSPTAVSAGVGGTIVPSRVVGRSRVSRTVEVGPCPAGCWLVHGEGWSSGWQAEVRGGSSLGEPEVVDGGFNGWWIAPTDEPTTVEIRWSPQSTMWPPLGLSVIGVAICMYLAFRRRSDPSASFPAVGGPDVRDRSAPMRPSTGQLAALVVGTALVVQPVWLAAAVAVAAIAWVSQRREVIGVIGVTLVVAIMAFYAWRVHDLHPFPGYGWIVNIDEMHRLAMFAVVLVAVGLSGLDPPTGVGVGERDSVADGAVEHLENAER